MSFGESNRSTYGGVSELTGRLSSVSGEVAATDANLDRKGSLGFIGGIGIFAEFLELTAQQRVLLLVEGADEDGARELIVTCRAVAMAYLWRASELRK
ncbi:hypothetical protein CDL15_Pgr018273 [Punica granatum]|uniref:Uncharacterized protein n=1 Tax=Punica granatum TaxID=22663 RepID=A0A218WIQ2_PUNGR|nr:hypothetical protein CDL15_Pgr018273 [Punica granatum]